MRAFTSDPVYGMRVIFCPDPTTNQVICPKPGGLAVTGSFDRVATTYRVIVAWVFRAPWAEVVPGLVELEVAVPRSTPALR